MLSLNDISKILQVKYEGEDKKINGLNLVNKGTKHNSIISYLTSSKFLNSLKANSSVKAIFLDTHLYKTHFDDLNDLSCFLVDYPEEMFYKLHHYLIENTDFYNEFESKLGENLDINKTTIIENGTVIGDNVSIGYNSIIKKGTVIGNNVTIGNNTIIGSEGFQLIKNREKQNMLIKHAGGCIISDNVSIGDSCSIGNSVFEQTTFVGKNTKIDNLVHVAHNCVIGANCVLTAGVILSGSTIIKDNVWLAPNSTISNKVILNENSFVGIGSVVIKSVKENERVFGNPSKTI